ncbi:activator of 2-hydroxyacyl-coa-hydratase-related [Anaeramoeba flamelloides]|uniref:N-acetyl-D-glucosamine kinase n=1 Tax=Anaeramoeba flamelloides TaxID=1746091 RepID=A0AAV7Z4F0_9EUKA|nr:activator of 2-hydroxyacyl-coa-hydratase-related [Anaeramoeba flamelloides]
MLTRLLPKTIKSRVPNIRGFTTTLGLDVGSTTVKACVVDSESSEIEHFIKPHHGRVSETIRKVVGSIGVEGSLSLVTGRQGRKMVDIPGVTEAVAIEEGLKDLMHDKEKLARLSENKIEKFKGIVSLGGESYIVYKIGGKNNDRIIDTFAGSKCASGTGQFFSQQLGRMDLDSFQLQDHHEEILKSKDVPLATRCSVFMKTDCTHKLNKGEATRYDIVLSLSKVMASKVVDLLTRAQIENGQVLIIGGMLNIPYVIDYIKKAKPEIEFIIPEEGTFFEAFGAAKLALKEGVSLPSKKNLLTPNETEFKRVKPFSHAKNLVNFVKPPKKETPKAGHEYIIGVDGGSTTTKVALIDMETKNIVTSFYGRTLGDPIKALRKCFMELKKDLGPVYDKIKIPLISTTGSSRELLGVFTGTKSVYNEIIAHTVGATFYQKDVDTIFEIGGQDAKYVYLRNRVPIDYAMNEACSAGTGSFLEESCAGDLKIMTPQEIAPIALSAEAPLKFSQHCSAFINTDIRRASQEGAKREDIVAGLVLSIGYNYLERVVGNRRIGDHILMQGGVAKNSAVPMSIASILNKKVTVPPNPELLGAFGVGLLAIEKLEEGLLTLDPNQNYNLDELINRPVSIEGEFKCKSCENDCPIKIIRVGKKKYFFGGRCNKYSNSQQQKTGSAKKKERLRKLKKKKALKSKQTGGSSQNTEVELELVLEGEEQETVDYVKLRSELLFGKHAAKYDDLEKDRTVVAVPAVFSVHFLWPLYSHFFKEIGVEARLVEELDEKGKVRCETDYCFPAEIAHEITETCVKMGDQIDHVFLPHLKKLQSLEKDVHAMFCPLSQGLPYFIKNSFNLKENYVLKPVLNFENSMEKSGDTMIEMAMSKLGISEKKAQRAWDVAVKRQRECTANFHSIGDKIMKKLEDNPPKKPVVVLFGRGYNAFTPTTNMSIPRKFESRETTVIPFDFISPTYGGTDEEIFNNMFWYFGQYNLKIAKKIQKMKNVYACWVTNFSCGPDAFILHYMRWIFNSKPFLVLELDSHVADAGVDTRIEAFLDIITGYNKANFNERPILKEKKWDSVIINKKVYFKDTQNPEREMIPMNGANVTFLFPPIGKLNVDLAASFFCQTQKIDTVSLPEPTNYSLSMARALMSGKECLPALLVLGSILHYFENNPIDKDRLYTVFLPTSYGPCRYGQYGIFYEALFRELGFDNLTMLQLNSYNSYAELGPQFLINGFFAFLMGDFFTDIRNTFRTLAVDRHQAYTVLNSVKKDLIKAMELGKDNAIKQLPSFVKRLKKVPLKMDPKDAPKVYVVGEIYLRRDFFSSEPLLDMLADFGIVCKVEDVSEWLAWVDYTHEYEVKKKLNNIPFWKRAFAPEMREYLKLQAEIMYKNYQHKRFKKILGKTGLLIESPSNRKELMSIADQFGGCELGTEAVPGSCAAATGMKHGFDGATVLYPFACIPGRLTESLYAPYARKMEYPTLCVENDGNPYSPTVVTNIETFAYNVISRFKERTNKN